MPTNEPLDPGDAEGQLKPIARFHEPAPAPAASAPSGVAGPGVQTDTAVARRHPAPTTASPGHATNVRRTTLSAPTLRLRNTAAAHSEEKGAPESHTSGKKPFTDADLQERWQNYIDTHTSEQLLINTMRTAKPERIADRIYEIVVESEIQVELMTESMPGLIDELRKALDNDDFIIKVRANNGASSPITWNEREVLADISSRHPELQDFITKLGLTLS